MPTNPLDVIIKIVTKIDPTGVHNAEKYLKQLEEMGVRWNEQAQRFQQVKGVTGGTAFVSGSEVQEKLGELARLEAQRTQAKIESLKAEEAIAQASERNIEAGENILALAESYNLSIKDTAEMFSGTLLGWGRSTEQLVQDAKAAADQGYRPAAKAAGDLVDNTNKVVTNTNVMKKNMADLRTGFIGFQLMMTGMALQRAGAGILSPVQRYNEFAGRAEPVSREWLDAQGDIEMSFVRIGRVMQEELLPAMKEAAHLAEVIANLVEKNPELAGGVAKGGVGLLIGGSVLMGIGQIWSGIFAIRQLFGLIVSKLPALGIGAAATGGTAAAGAAATAPAAGTAGAAALGAGSWFGLISAAILAGMAQGKMADMITDKIREAFDIADRTEIDSAKDVVANVFLDLLEQFIAGPAGMVFVNLDNATQSLKQGLQSLAENEGVVAWLEKLGIDLNLLADASEEASNKIVLSQAALDTYTKWFEESARAAEEYQKAVGKEEADYAEERAQTVEEHSRDMAQTEEDYMRQRSVTVANFARQMARDEADYARQRQQSIDDFNRDNSQRIADHNREVADLQEQYEKDIANAGSAARDRSKEAWEDYYKRLRELERTHQDNVEDLVAARDAIGLAEERRRYNREQEKARDDLDDKLNDIQESAQAERAAARERLQERLQEMQEEFQIEQARRLQEFQIELQRRDDEFAIRQERAKKDFEAELKQRDQEHQIKMTRMEEEYRRELRLMESEHAKKLNELQKNYNDERKQRNENLKAAMQDIYNIEKSGYDQMVAGAKDYVARLLAEAEALKNNTSTTGTRQSGGYVSAGIWKLHDDEYVMNAATTRTAERLVGGSLTQRNLLGALAGVNGGSTINIALPAGMLTQQLRKEMRLIVESSFSGQLAELLEGLI